MIKKIITILTLGYSLFALDVPIHNKQKFVIINGEFTIFSFPFEIKKTITSGFLLKKSAKEIKKFKENESEMVFDPRLKKPVKIKKNGAIKIKAGKKSITMLPRQRGTFEIIIWGYKKYPLIIDIEVIDKKELPKGAHVENYYNFLDTDAPKKEARKFEETSHEKAIVKLIRSIYNKKLPSGYKSVNFVQVFDNAGLRFTSSTAYVGNKYRAEEWYIKNLTNNTINLYEEMFVSEGIFAISIENNILKPNEETRVFIVRANFKKGGK